MLKIIKKNFFLSISTFLILYFFFNLLDGERGLLSYLKKNKCDNVTKKSNETRFYVTDFPQRFDELGSCFLERELKTVEHISLM